MAGESDGKKTDRRDMRRSKKKDSKKATAVIPEPDAYGVRKTDFRFNGETMSLLKSLVGKKLE